MAITMMVEISPSGVWINKQVKHNSKQTNGWRGCGEKGEPSYTVAGNANWYNHL